MNALPIRAFATHLFHSVKQKLHGQAGHQECLAIELRCFADLKWSCGRPGPEPHLCWGGQHEQITPDIIVNKARIVSQISGAPCRTVHSFFQTGSTPGVAGARVVINWPCDCATAQCKAQT